jgi:Ca2+-transporting ATPase
MSLLLGAAALVAWAGLGEGLDALAILTIVVLNAVIGSLEEGRAERALDALRSLEAPSATVIRQGTRSTIDAREVVRGDLIVLTAGDRVPADVRLIEASLLQIDESLLTGESLPVAKHTGGPGDAATEEGSGEEGSGRALSGTLVVAGSGLGEVEDTGVASSIGKIAAHLEDPQRATPLQRELQGVTARLGIASMFIAVGVFALTLARTGLTEAGLQRSFLSAVALAVAAVPEGLATVVAVSLALGVRRMAAKGAIVRRLPAVETLGSATVILTDKTGTLTENRMRLDTVAMEGRGPMDWTELSLETEEPIVEAIVLCSDATIDPPTGDPLEIALLEAVGPGRVQGLRSSWQRVAVIPFDARRRRMATVHVAPGREHVVLHVKGAPEVVLDRCTRALGSSGPQDFTEASRSRLREGSDRMAARGIRTLGLARRELESVGDDPRLEERELTFIGLVGLRDPVRSHAQAAVEDARSAGIDVVMVTGDHPGTAAAIAVQVGLMDRESPVITGDVLQLDGVPDRLPEATVYARVDPDEKLALVQSFQDDGHVVAVTGDGVNDAPALRRADIGVAMGRSGSEVAREAADMVITDDDLATVVEAVREGRGIYDNLRKVVDYLVGGNLSEISVVVGSLILFPELGIPLLPLQLLWINLLTDGFPALALGIDPAAEGLMRRPPRPASQRLLAISGLPVLAWRALLIAGAAIGSLAVTRFAFEASWGRARTVMFCTLVVTHLLYAFVVRGGAGGRERPTLRDLGTNKALLFGIGTGLLLQFAIVALPAAREVFGTTSLPASGWALVAAAAALSLLTMLATAKAHHLS